MRETSQEGYEKVRGMWRETWQEGDEKGEIWGWRYGKRVVRKREI